jgi:hypothetical protein
MGGQSEKMHPTKIIQFSLVINGVNISSPSKKINFKRFLEKPELNPTKIPQNPKKNTNPKCNSLKHLKTKPTMAYNLFIDSPLFGETVEQFYSNSGNSRNAYAESWKKFQEDHDTYTKEIYKVIIR